MKSGKYIRRNIIKSQHILERRNYPYSNFLTPPFILPPEKQVFLGTRKEFQEIRVPRTSPAAFFNDNKPTLQIFSSQNRKLHGFRNDSLEFQWKFSFCTKN